MAKFSKYFEYCKDSGIVTNKTKRNNCCTIGEPVGSVNGAGYLVVTFFGETLLLHRVIWELVYGEKPDTIDHINGIRTDNRLCNLRNVTRADNSKNLSLSKRSKTGQIGVTWCKQTDKYKVTIFAEGKNKTLGRYKDLDVAIQVRKDAEMMYGYHTNHGKK